MVSGSVIHCIRYSLICRLGHGQPGLVLDAIAARTTTPRWKKLRMWRLPSDSPALPARRSPA